MFLAAAPGAGTRAGKRCNDEGIWGVLLRHPACMPGHGCAVGASGGACTGSAHCAHACACVCECSKLCARGAALDPKGGQHALLPWRGGNKPGRQGLCPSTHPAAQ